MTPHTIWVVEDNPIVMKMVRHTLENEGLVNADSTPHQIEQMLEAGVRDFLTKPISAGKLFEILSNVLYERSDA